MTFKNNLTTLLANVFLLLRILLRSKAKIYLRLFFQSRYTSLKYWVPWLALFSTFSPTTIWGSAWSLSPPSPSTNQTRCPQIDPASSEIVCPFFIAIASSILVLRLLRLLWETFLPSGLSPLRSYLNWLRGRSLFRWFSIGKMQLFFHSYGHILSENRWV